MHTSNTYKLCRLYLGIYIYKYECAVTSDKKKEVMNLKESKEEYIGGLEEKGEM